MKLSHLSSNRSEFSTIEFDSDSVSRDFEATVYPAAALPELGGMGRCDSGARAGPSLSRFIGDGARVAATDPDAAA